MSKALDKQESSNLVDAAEIAATFRDLDKLLIVSHRAPDGDCLGSTMGLYHGLKSLGKIVAAYNHTPLHEKWSFLPGHELIKSEMPEWTPDATVFVDCGGVKRVHDNFEPVGLIINIDHHLTNNKFGDINFIDIEAASVGDQIYHILKEMGVQVSRDIATSLYLSIMSDTGGFRYSNTTSRAFRIAAELVELGADPWLVSRGLFESRSKGEFALMAKVLGTLQYEFDDLFVWSQLTWADYEANGGVDSEPEGLASEIRSVKTVEISALIHELEEGGARCGWRGKGSIDCSAIAQSCGGGGHFNASGALIRDKPYPEARDEFLKKTRDFIAEYLKSIS